MCRYYIKRYFWLTIGTYTLNSYQNYSGKFSVENILAPNKFGHNGMKELGNEDSKEHTDDEEEQGKNILSVHLKI